MEDAQPANRTPLTRAVLRNPAIVLTVLYLGTSLVGVSFAIAYFGAMGLNVFLYWEPSDFFLAAFREPISVLFALMALAYGYLARLDPAAVQESISAVRARWLGRLPAPLRYDVSPALARVGMADNQPRRRESLLIATVIGILLFLLGVGVVVAKRTGRLTAQTLNDPSLPKVELLLVTQAAPMGGFDKDDDLFLFAVSNQYVFAYERSASRMHVIPIGAIVDLRLVSRPRIGELLDRVDGRGR